MLCLKTHDQNYLVELRTGTCLLKKSKALKINTLLSYVMWQNFTLITVCSMIMVDIKEKIIRFKHWNYILNLTVRQANAYQSENLLHPHTRKGVRPRPLRQSTAPSMWVCLRNHRHIFTWLRNVDAIALDALLYYCNQPKRTTNSATISKLVLAKKKKNKPMVCHSFNKGSICSSKGIC